MPNLSDHRETFLFWSCCFQVAQHTGLPLSEVTAEMQKLVMKKIDPVWESYYAKRRNEEYEKAREERTCQGAEVDYTAAHGVTMPDHDEWFTVDEIKGRRAVYGSYHDVEVDWLIDRIEGLESIIRWMTPAKHVGDHDFCYDWRCQCWENEPEHADLLRQVVQTKDDERVSYQED